MRLFMVVYHRKEEKPMKECETARVEYTRVDYARTEKRAKQTAILELAGNTEFTAATVYYLQTGGYSLMRKVAEFGERGSKET